MHTELEAQEEKNKAYKLKGCRFDKEEKEKFACFSVTQKNKAKQRFSALKCKVQFCIDPDNIDCQALLLCKLFV